MIYIGTANLETFFPHVGAVFSLDQPEQHEQFTLARAIALTGHDYRNKRREPFSLFFNGARTDQQFTQEAVIHRHLVMRGLHLGQYLRWIEGGNGSGGDCGCSAGEWRKQNARASVMSDPGTGPHGGQ